MLKTRKTMVSWQVFPSLLPHAPLAFLWRQKLPFPKLPFPSFSNACHAGYYSSQFDWYADCFSVNMTILHQSEAAHLKILFVVKGVFFFPSPFPFIPLFCSFSNFRDTLAQKSLRRRLRLCRNVVKLKTSKLININPRTAIGSDCISLFFFLQHLQQ